MLGFVAASVLGGWTPRALAQQWTITYVQIEGQAAAVLGPSRVDPMNKALDRAKKSLETILAQSTGSVSIKIDWTAPNDPVPSAESEAVLYHANRALVRDRLIAQATADSEPESEIFLYESLPQAGSLSYLYETSTPIVVDFIAVTKSLNKHIGVAADVQGTDGTIFLRPPNSERDWQFWPSLTPNASSNRDIFEAVAVHETMHLLGFFSRSDIDSLSTAEISTWDLFRFNDGDTPISASEFSSLSRELRPTQEASGITALNSSSKTYPMSRGKRTGGDGSQAGHWRSFERLAPANAVGIMDPSASGAVYASLSKQYYTRADVEALDVIGWNINPNSLQFASADSVQQIAPTALAQIDQGVSISFQWEAFSSEDVTLLIYQGTSITNDEPVRVFYQMPAGTTTLTLGACEALPPGEYVWGIVGRLANRDITSGERRFTILPACDSLDFNNDTFSPDSGDLDDFIGVFGGGPSACSTFPTPGCNDLDFNNDGFSPDSLDIDAFISRLGGGPCLQ